MSTESLRVMTYNIWMGGGDRIPQILEVIREASPDILVLEECLNWSRDELAPCAHAMDVPADEAHARVAPGNRRTSGHLNVSVLSRLPFRSVRLHDEAGRVSHVMVELEVEWAGRPLTVWGTHLSASSEDQRLKQVEYLREVLDGPRLAVQAMLLLGDLNALSRHDVYPDDLTERLQARGVTKYGIPIRHDVMNGLEEMGWIDTMRPKDATVWRTAPRAYGEVRIDYILASPIMASLLEDTHVIVNDEASDHRPVVATFRSVSG